MTIDTSRQTSGSPKVSVLVGGKLYSIDPHKIPYFQSYIDFQTNAGVQPVHDNIPYFDAAFAGVEKGYRHCFRHLPVDLEAYHGLCETLDFLCVDVLAGSSLDQIIGTLKAGKGDYELEYKHYIFVKGNKAIARNASFLFVYQMLKGDFADEHRDSAKVFNAVKYVVSHRAVFKYAARMIVRAAYEERFQSSGKQIAELDNWPILEPGKDGRMPDEDVTTEEESSSDYSDDDY